MAERKYDGFIPGPQLIEAYGSGGFRFAGMSHLGSILALPSGIHAWGAADAKDIDYESLKPILAEPQGAVKFLLIGTGAAMAQVDPRLLQKLRAAGLSVDTMATGHAVSTYNIMLGERRPVAAALVAAP